MTEEAAERWLRFGERVGWPMVVLLAVMFGVYRLAVPIAESAIEFMAIQTSVLHDMHKDLEATRKIVERDALERKAETLAEIQGKIDRGFHRLEAHLRMGPANVPHMQMLYEEEEN